MKIVSIFFLISNLSILNGYDSEMFNRLQSRANHNTPTCSEILQEILRRLPKGKDIAPLKEVAHKRPVTQSTTGFPATLAVDGSLRTTSHTALEDSPYLVVDLRKEYQIQRIEIFNRIDCCGERLHDLDITIGPSLNHMYLCAHFKGPGRTAGHLVFNCNFNTRHARYVKLTINGKEILNVAEVKVYALDE